MMFVGVFRSVDDDYEEEDLWSWGWTLSSEFSYPGSPDSDPDSYQDHCQTWTRRIMSRRSLRIDDSLLDRSLPHSSASFTVGAASAAWKKRSHLSRRLSSSCSESLLVHTPHKQNPVLNNTLNSTIVNSSGVHSVAASDASLLSSLLDESSIQESTHMDGFWGLDSDADPKESTVVYEQSTIIADTTVTGPEASSCSKRSSGHCKDCNQTDSKYSGPSCTSASSCSSGSLRPGTKLGPGTKPELEPVAGSEVPYPTETQKTPTIYCRGRRHKGSVCSVMKESKEKQSNGALSKTAADVFRWIRRKFTNINSDKNKRFPLGFLLFLLLVFGIIFSLLWSALPVLYSVSVSELVEKELPFIHSTSSEPEPGSHTDPPTVDQSQNTAVQNYQEPHQNTEPTTETREAPGTEEKFSDVESSRLERLEQSVSSLWQHLEKGMRDLIPADPRASPQDGEEALVLSVNSVLEQQLEHIRSRLEEDHRLWERAQSRDQELQQTHSIRLDQIELQLITLTKRTEDLERKQAAALRDWNSVPAALSSGVESQDVLYTELSRLQGALQTVRQEVEALSSCRGKCTQLEKLREMLSPEVSVLVLENLRSLVFGSQLASPRDSLISKSLLQFISDRFVNEEHLQGALSSLEIRLMEHIRHMDQKKSEAKDQEPGGALTQEDVLGIVQKALRQFSEDRTGLADYALESGGGSVVGTRCSQTYETKAALLSLFGFPLWYFSQSPRAVIQPDVHPGNCWAFRGQSGMVVIRLSLRIKISGFSVDHIPKSLSPSGTLHSAPKDFSVYGLHSEREYEEDGSLLGTFEYDQDGEALQTFTVTEENEEPFQIVLVKVLTNWGHEDYTCLYRFRVHGTPVTTSEELSTDQDLDQDEDED